MYVCVDFDGTVVDHMFPEIGQEAPGAIKWLTAWQENGAKLILFTMRSDGQKSGLVLTEAVSFLSENGIDLYGINRNPTQHHWTGSPKAYGKLYVDDAAFGCPLHQPEGFNRPCVNWSIVGPAVLEMLKK